MKHGDLLEVELKFALPNPDVFWRRFQEQGLRWSDAIEQVDTYYAHPIRHFAETDEALRIRRVHQTGVLTYKGPVTDRRTKTRLEVEARLCEGSSEVAAMARILEAIGFKPVRDVVKTRRSTVVTWKGQSITLGWDCVPSLGTFIELEIVTPDEGKQKAQSTLLDYAASLGLTDPESRSYLELLLNQNPSL